jgi:hypothetical protein
MSIFGFYFVTGLLREAGWPRRKGFLNNTAVIDTTILDSAIDQMVDWAAALGAGRPTLAIQTIAEMFRDRDWIGDERPNIKVFIESARTENENWRAAGAIAPHDVVKPARFAGTGRTIDAKDFKGLGPPLEHWFLWGVLWGIANPTAFEKWYHAYFEDQINKLPLMRDAGLAVEAPPDLAESLADSEVILRNYERDISPLPAIPESLLADARALGRQL